MCWFLCIITTGQPLGRSLPGCALQLFPALNIESIPYCYFYCNNISDLLQTSHRRSSKPAAFFLNRSTSVCPDKKQPTCTEPLTVHTSQCMARGRKVTGTEKDRITPDAVFEKLSNDLRTDVRKRVLIGVANSHPKVQMSAGRDAGRADSRNGLTL